MNGLQFGWLILMLVLVAIAERVSREEDEEE